ncbi:MAG: cytosine deaminase, partial [Nodosilinea sp.]
MTLPLTDLLAAQPTAYWLCHARVPIACLDAAATSRTPIAELAAPPRLENLAAVHLHIQAGTIVALVPASSSVGDDLPDDDLPRYDLGNSLVWPCFADCHTHLDKGQSWLRSPNPDGTFYSAVDAVAADRRHWSASDLYPRMSFGLRCSYAHGTQAVRTHLDCVDGQADISFAVFDRLRQEWADRLVLQAVCLVPIDYYYDHPDAEKVADTVAHYSGILGGATYPQPDLEAKIDRAFDLAEARGLDLDFHADESLDPDAEGLRMVAETKLRRGFSGRVNCGHCCSL